MSNFRTDLGALGALSLMAAGAGACLAQEQAAPPPEPQQQQVAPPAQPPGDLPGLDDLLGLPKPADQGPGPEDAPRRELQDKLAGREIAEQFSEAVRLMGQTADRLQASKDTGLATQRLQEDVLRKLDALIESAKKQKSNSGSGSPRPDQQKRPGQPNQPQNPRNQAGRGDNRGQVDPPARRDGQTNPAVDQTGAAWGSLPAYVREALSQGTADAYSTLYRALTEAYYRRVVEEAGK